MQSDAAESRSPGPGEALAILMAGNRRWADGEPQHPNRGRERRQQLVAGQSPLAVVLSCIDSRVPPELVFDCGLGDVLAVRSGAHICDDVVLGSVEYGPCQLRTPLIVVLGHHQCGAVRAAVGAFQDDVWPPGHIADVIEALRPAFKLALEQPGADLVDDMVRAHTVLTVADLRSQPVLAERIADDSLGIVGGHYDLRSGTIELIA